MNAERPYEHLSHVDLHALHKQWAATKENATDDVYRRVAEMRLKLIDEEFGRRAAT